jgi:ATP-dependent helicase/nuclease subunit A
LTGEEDVLRIMTIHGSKGLEFPVVILGGLGKLFSQSGSGDDTLLFHREAGLSLQWRDPSTHTYKKTLLHNALKLRKNLDERAESIRLLYVAMTRAMDTLHMIGTMRDPDKMLELFKIEEASPAVDTDLPGATSYLQLIMPAVIKRSDLFDVTVWRPESLYADSFPSPVKTGKEPAKTDEEPAKTDEAQHYTDGTFIYPYAAAEKLKSKYSVTELAGHRGDDPVAARNVSGEEALKEKTVKYYIEGGKDDTNGDADLTRAEKGTALHTALELLDISEAYVNRDNSKWFIDYLDELKVKGALSGAEVCSIDVKTLERLANSNLASRAAASEFLMRETPFNMIMPYSDTVYESETSYESDAAYESGRENKTDGSERYNEEIIVQGIIDLLFEEEGSIVIVDYKSGRFDTLAYEAEVVRIRSEYRTQLRLYSKAVEMIFEKPVIERLVYMTGPGLTISL